jgi:hypothetical protein
MVRSSGARRTVEKLKSIISNRLTSGDEDADFKSLSAEDATFGSGATESIEDITAALLTAGDKLTWTYDDANDELLIDTTALDLEEVEDTVAALLTSDSNLTVSYDDANDSLTVGLSDSISVGSLSAADEITDPSGTGHTGQLADADDPVTDFGVGTVQDGEVLTNSGGSLDGATVNTVPNVPNWAEDANSPLNFSNSQSGSITLNGTYDRIKVKFQIIDNVSDTNQDIQLRVNGETAQYSYVLADGTTTTGASQWPIVPDSLNSGSTVSGQLHLDSGGPGIQLSGPFGSNGTGPTTIVAGANFNVSTPVDTITVRGASDVITAKARVYGWNGGL